MAQDIQADETLETLKKEAIKIYRVYDGSGRCTESYEAPAHAIEGGPCLKTVYVYDGATTRVLKMRETFTSWQAAWDI